jgi:hypothetical protein
VTNYRSTGESSDLASARLSFAMCEPAIADRIGRLAASAGLGFAVAVSAAGVQLSVASYPRHPDVLHLHVFCRAAVERAGRDATALRMEDLGLVAGTLPYEFVATVPRTAEGVGRATRMVMDLLREVGNADADAQVRIDFVRVGPRAWQVLGFVGALAALSAPALYWVVTDSGPARILVDWQASWDRGRFSPSATFGALFVMNGIVTIAVLAAVGAVVRLVRRGLGAK